MGEFYNDLQVQNAIEEIKNTQEEIDRLKALFEEWKLQKKMELDAKIEKLQNIISYNEQQIRDYVLNSEKKKETKTQYKLRFIDCDVVVKKAHKTIKKPDIAITEDNLDEIISQYGNRYIKTKTKYDFDWTEYKKNLTITEDGEVLNTKTGEILDIETEFVPEKVEIK